MPNAGVPGDYDRFSYVKNALLKYIDPSGHRPDDGCSTEGCSGNPNSIVITKPKTKTSIQIDIPSATILALDFISLAISFGEALIADSFGLAILALGCGGGGAATAGLSCEISIQLAVAVNMAVASPASGFGAVETGLGYLSLALTWYFDGNNGYVVNENGQIISVTIGKDTLVAARNAFLGTFTESNLDLWASASQFQYDIDRITGKKTGGGIEVWAPNGISWSGFLEFWEQLLLGDWW